MTKEEAYHYIDNLKWLKGFDNTTIGEKTVGEILDEIKDMLKEQEAVKPKYTPKSIYSWECGVCAEPFDRIANYCPECGRKVKWE